MGDRRFDADNDKGRPDLGTLRVRELERRLRVDEHGAEVRERREQDRAEDREDEEYRSRHRH
jgi:hypothetical protein